MIDFKDIGKYKENNRLEAKKAQGGLSRSIWETYSAFANTIGGIILLGVEEQKDKTFRTVPLDNPEKLVQDFWNGINNIKQVNLNILTDRNVQIVEAQENRIIVIDVPRANRKDKPIYIGENPFSGSFRRNGEGDYHCTKDEVLNMLRDQADISQDMKVLENLGLDVFDYESVKRYRIRMANQRPGHIWESLDDEEFLKKIGAVGRGEDHHSHPTAAGLLMFGFEHEIVKEFPNYFLDYQEKLDDKTRWSDRIISSSGDWSGNIFDFYFRVYNKIAQDIKVPFKIANGTDRVDDTPVHEALREALANALIHANYYGRQGLVIQKKKDEILIANPGSFRISIDDAFSGGISDPRNATLVKMFNLITIGDRAGSGLHKIQFVWKHQNWEAPKLSETFDPDRTTLSLVLKKTGDKKSAIKTGDKKSAIKSDQYKDAIINYLTDNPTGKASDISGVINLGLSRTKDYLKLLVDEELIVAEGANKNRVYKLKS